MTGNGIESDFVLPDSLFISDYSTLPAFYPHFGANCRFFAQLACRRIHLRFFLPEPEALPLDSAKGSSTLWTPFRAIELVTTAYFFRVFIGGTQGALPLDPAKGSLTLWTPFRAIELDSSSYFFRVFIQETDKTRRR